MTTKVTITGTGMPMVDAHRAGPGVLVQVGDLALQFDVGRNTASRIVGAGVGILDLDTVFLTHLIPPPKTPEAREGFANDLRDGGYTGEIMVCDDLDSVTLEAGVVQ